MYSNEYLGFFPQTANKARRVIEVDGTSPEHEDLLILTEDGGVFRAKEALWEFPNKTNFQIKASILHNTVLSYEVHHLVQ